MFLSMMIRGSLLKCHIVLELVCALNNMVNVSPAKASYKLNMPTKILLNSW